MNLFSKEKEFVLKLINGILLIWLIIAMVVILSNIVNVFIKDPNLTYDEYRVVNCLENNGEATMLESDCQNSYQASDVNDRIQNYYYYRSSIICLSNILIVGGVLFLLNKEKEEKPKPKPKTKKATK